jgi:hypothetical protein
LAVGVEFVLRAERWRLILGEPPARRGILFPTVAGAFFLNNVLPFRAGEAARVYWTHRVLPRPLGACVAALLVDRLLDVLSVAILLLWAVAGGVGFGLSHKTLLLALGGGAGGLSFFLFLARCPEQAERLAERCRLPAVVRRFLGSFAEGSRALSSLPALAGALALSGGIWGLNVLVFRIAGAVFGLDLTFAQGGWLLGAIALGAALPSTPGYVGTYEAAGVAALSLLGHDKSLSFSFLVLLHLGQIIGSALFGAPSLWVNVHSATRKDDVLGLE